MFCWASGQACAYTANKESVGRATTKTNGSECEGRITVAAGNGVGRVYKFQNGVDATSAQLFANTRLTKVGTGNTRVVLVECTRGAADCGCAKTIHESLTGSTNASICGESEGGRASGTRASSDSTGGTVTRARVASCGDGVELVRSAWGAVTCRVDWTVADALAADELLVGSAHLAVSCVAAHITASHARRAGGSRSRIKLTNWADSAVSFGAIYRTCLASAELCSRVVEEVVG